MIENKERYLTRIGIFYDGNYFYHVSNYYCYGHARKSRLSIPGIHEFIKRYISLQENTSPTFCQIVDCHYFRGRLPALEANERQILLNERIFDDILMREGIVTHYLPITRGGEKGVDVSLALEALELTLFKKFNVVALIASDGDYIPLVRKLNSLGTRVMVLGWDFEYTDDNGNTRYTSTSSRLLNEAAYPLRMHDFINGTKRYPDISPDLLFVNNPHDNYPEPREEYDDVREQDGEVFGGPVRKRGRIVQLKSGYGFISTDVPGKNLFFYTEQLRNCDFNELMIGDLMEYEPGFNDRGECCKNVELIAHPERNS
ncbi:MAG: NYN domain-containing protein [Lentisphaeria bacterium]|nr:NYN domain-containing protein [Lentisphaeria bacterium]